jgi:peptidoglycan/xylan/chitin deacetylase (PgdA/CDA1 family)
VSGMTKAGTVIATLAAGVAHDTAGNASLASTSTDNTVTLSSVPSVTAAKIVFTFDDGWADQRTNAFPIMQAAGFKGTAYIMRDSTINSEPDMMNMSQVNDLYNAGWDISNHTTNHDDNGGDTSAARLATLTTEYQENQQWIISNGWTRGAYHVCYPSGAFSDQLITILKGMGVLTGRSVIYGNQSIPVTDFFRIPVQYVETGNVAEVKASVDSAIQTGSTVVLMIHRVEPTAGDLVTITSDFQNIVDYVKSKNDSIAVMTMSEWYNYAQVYQLLRVGQDHVSSATAIYAPAFLEIEKELLAAAKAKAKH